MKSYSGLEKALVSSVWESKTAQKTPISGEIGSCLGDECRSFLAQYETNGTGGQTPCMAPPHGGEVFGAAPVIRLQTQSLGAPGAQHRLHDS